MLRNEVVKVDINDKELGAETKENAHTSPILHRAFSVYLYNDKGQILIQKRALNKYHSGGLWANACCSHPKSKENIKESAINRLKEELGVHCSIEEIYSFIYLNKFNDNLFEYEYDHVFIGKYTGKIKINPEEVCETTWIEINSLEKDLINNPLKYASWFIISAPIVIKYLKEKKN